MPSEIRDVTDLAGCRAVVDVEIEVWGRDAEIVPASVLVASVKRGGILIGAWDGLRLAGFVWSMPGIRNGQLTHWSHMLGVRPDARGGGLGLRLKHAQRDRALAMGIELIEWTFDPLQAVNAHLNLSVLGCESSEYRVNTYGEMSGPLHRGTPTDRLVAEWWLRGPSATSHALDLVEVPCALVVSRDDPWIVGEYVADCDDARVLIPVPPRFNDMQRDKTELARAWRGATREAFSSYFARGYRAVGFTFDRESGGGAYLLTK